jgi:predicted metal-dependent hydrolase
MSSEARSTIVVRRIPFEFPGDVKPHWIPGKPELAQMWNGASMTMPYLEPFLIRTMREAISHIKDPLLHADGEAFISQEGQHFRVHRRFNDQLISSGPYSELIAVEAQMDEFYVELSKKSLAHRLAFSAGFESMTMGMTRWLIGERCKLFKGADPRVVSFVLWHMVEETEHKTVAFDVYQALFSSYWTRMFGVLHGSYGVLSYGMRACIVMLKKDGLWNDWRSRFRLLVQAAVAVRHVGPYLLRAMLPWHSPRFERDLDWVSQWIKRFPGDVEMGSIPLVDTNNPDMPVPTLTFINKEASYGTGR